MLALLGAVLVASLIGSLHCAGMCGPFCAFAVATTPDAAGARGLLHVLYHGGRLITYTLLGAVSGALGAALNLGASAVGLQEVAAILAGAMMVLVGLVIVLRHCGVGIPQAALPSVVQNVVVWLQRVAFSLKPTQRALAIGLLSTVLPCGWLYAFAVTAAGTGSVIWGAAVMAAFWIGSVPVLLAIGLGTQTVTRLRGRLVPVVASLAIVLVGLLTLMGRIQIDARAFGATSPRGETLIEQVEHAADETPACCQHGG